MPKKITDIGNSALETADSASLNLQTKDILSSNTKLCDLVSRLETRLDTLEFALSRPNVDQSPTYASVVTNGTSTSLSGKNTNLQQIGEEHALNLVFTGIPECLSGGKDKRKMADYDHAAAALLYLTSESTSIVDVYRKGSLRDDGSARPLLVKLKSEWDVHKIMAKRAALKDYQSGKIFVNRDLPAADRPILARILKKRRDLILSGHSRANIRINKLRLFLNGQQIDCNSSPEDSVTVTNNALKTTTITSTTDTPDDEQLIYSSKVHPKNGQAS